MAHNEEIPALFQLLSAIDTEEMLPRIGKLSLRGRKPLETPNFIALSSRGVIPHVTPEILLQRTQIGGVHMALEDFTEKANTSTIPVMNCPGSNPLHTFTSLPDSIFTLLAPRRSPAVVAPVGNSDTALSIFTSTGFQVLSNKLYISYIQKLRPDIAIGLGDITYGSTPGTKRIAKMPDRTRGWLTELLSEKDKQQMVFAPILPIDLQSQWEYLDSLADENAADIDGLALYDSNLLSDIPATTALAALPRLSLDEPASPHHILRQISLGMDIFALPFIGFATDAGIALAFSFPSSADFSESVDGMGSSVRPLGIDMWATEHATSIAPLYSSCTCWVCTSHHRAFLQHLLSAKEMLGWVLLQVHNHEVLSTFFAAVRSSIKDGTFTADCEKFAKAYESELPEKSGQGPRARGYHFKSEGPGEQKRNKAAWDNLGGDDQVVDGGLVPDEASSELEEKGFAEKADS